MPNETDSSTAKTALLVEAGLLGELRNVVLLPLWLKHHASWARQPGKPALLDSEVPCIRMCRHTTVYTMRLLAELGIETRGVWGKCIGPAKTDGHAWLECGDMRLDLTAEQFGGPAVLWAPVSPDASGTCGGLVYAEDPDPSVTAWRLRNVKPTVRAWELVESGDWNNPAKSPDPLRARWIESAKHLLETHGHRVTPLPASRQKARR